MVSEENVKRLLQCSQCKGESFRLEKHIDNASGDESVIGLCQRCGHAESVVDMSKHESSIWEKIGELGINTGTVLICDPCYVAYITNDVPPGGIPEKPLQVEPVMRGLQLIEETIWFHHIKNSTLASQIKDSDATGIAGVVASTGFGDGMYEIFAKITDYEGGGKRISEIRIRFDEAIGWDDPETKEIKHFTMSDMFQKVVEHSRLDRVSKIVGRKIESLDELSDEEAEKVIAVLQEHEKEHS